MLLMMEKDILMRKVFEPINVGIRRRERQTVTWSEDTKVAIEKQLYKWGVVM